VIRQELVAEKGTIVSLRTVERAVQAYRQELAAEARATVRFETPPGKQLQIDFGERLVEIAGSKVRTYLFVATLGYSRRQHIRAFRNERQESWFEGLESTFTKFAGVTEEILIDNPRALARISHTTECIGVANQRKPLCRNNSSSIRGAPRCRQSVARISLDLNLLKAARW
jgi:transposase-like protein